MRFQPTRRNRLFTASVDGLACVFDVGGCPADVDDEGAFYTLVPIRPRSRCERRSLRTFPGDSLRPPLAFNPRLRRLSTPPDAFQLHPDVRLYGTTLTKTDSCA